MPPYRLIRFLSALSIVGMIALLPHPASATDVLTSEIKTMEYSSGGNLTGCGVNYTAAYLDYTYRAGGLSGVSGSINWMMVRGGLGLFFKIALLDFPGQQTSRPVFGKIHHGFVSLPKPLKLDRVLQCDNKNAYCEIAGQDTAMKSLLQMNGAMKVGFNRNPGGMDVVLDVTPSPPEAEKLFTCVQQLLKDQLDKMQPATPKP